jgi:ribosomal-protein-alanine N-acetyltransferase
VQQSTLQTDRLVLRPFEFADAPDVQRLAGAREIADTTLRIPHPYPDGAAAEWIRTHEPAWERGTSVTYAITLGGTAVLIGAIGLDIARHSSWGELGYWVAVSRWNRGYCNEAARAVLAFGFSGLRLHRIQARHLTRNPSSGRVMQKIGMRLEGVHREAVRKWDRFEDLAVYGVLASEWSAAGGTAPAPAPEVV